MPSMTRWLPSAVSSRRKGARLQREWRIGVVEIYFYESLSRLPFFRTEKYTVVRLKARSTHSYNDDR
jgi:hypothetical protein